MIEQRKARRFELKLPFELVRNGSAQTRLEGTTVNISSVGVLFSIEANVELGDSLEYLITLPTSLDSDIVRIRCLGKVVRLGSTDIAATLERYEFVRAARTPRGEDPALDAARVPSRRKFGAS